jgi:uncharacterized repeat protein (TIGR03803 family)
MKTCIKHLIFILALIAGLGLMLSGRVPAQTFTALHDFTALDSSGTNSDGAAPDAGLILSGGTLYGTANNGGIADRGTVFKVNTDGTGFTNLYSFSATSGPFPQTNRDGAFPRAVLLLSGTNLYGTAWQGGNAGFGTVFRVNTDGTSFTNLHSFPAISGPNPPTNSAGASPLAGLVLSGNTLYGTAFSGGTNGTGTVFALNTDGTGFTDLHNFPATSGPVPATNSEGAFPEAGLVLSGNTLYGTAAGGGTNGTGTVFALNTDGSGFRNLHHFGVRSGSSLTNSDGSSPEAGLVLSGGTLYGTADIGGTNGTGTVFSLNTNGTAFAILHVFMTRSGNSSPNGDGANPSGPLILSGDTLYGTATGGGTNGTGTVFALNTNGTGFANLYNFTALDPITSTNHDGDHPNGPLILSGETLYGTASEGGDSLFGTVFSLALEPHLNILLSGTNVILTWPANSTGFALEFVTNLVSPAVWNTNLPAPVATNGTNTVTNAISGTQRFYRLSQ